MRLKFLTASEISGICTTQDHCSGPDVDSQKGQDLGANPYLTVPTEIVLNTKRCHKYINRHKP